jgi:glycosyltransferase involved in cell wall biosynthesis
MSKATIIQDADRAEVLLRANEINQTNLIYVPISVLGDTNEKRYNYFNDTFNIGIDKKIILCLGLITKNRLSHELADVARSLDDAYIMILHGPGEKEEIKQLAVKFSSSNLIISDKLVPHSLMKIMISSAHVGLVFFDKINANNRLTAFSSEKIALYLQSGIPIIGLDMGNYRRLMNRYHCGELVSEFKELPEAINKIMNNHASYSRNAYLAYREIYSLEKHVQSIQKYLEKMND